jgi:hypothetical protein
MNLVTKMNKRERKAMEAKQERLDRLVDNQAISDMLDQFACHPRIEMAEIVRIRLFLELAFPYLEFRIDRSVHGGEYIFSYRHPGSNTRGDALLFVLIESAIEKCAACKAKRSEFADQIGLYADFIVGFGDCIRLECRPFSDWSYHNDGPAFNLSRQPPSSFAGSR